MAASLTAIIVAHDSAGVLPACLAALAGQGVRTIVVDNASEDATVAVAEAAGARVIRNAKNEGFGRANNLGVAAAETDFCLLINPDLVLEAGAVAALMAAAERYASSNLAEQSLISPQAPSAPSPRFSGERAGERGLVPNKTSAPLPTSHAGLGHPRITSGAGSLPAEAGRGKTPAAGFGLIAPRIIEPDGRVFYQNRSLLTESVLRRPVAGEARAVVPDGDACAPFLSGACLLVRREAFLALGGFDPNIFLFYEDDDLCRRFLDVGLPLIHVNEALATHARGQSSTPKPGRRYKARWHMGWSRVYIARKYGLKTGAMRTILLNAPKALLAILTLQRTEAERYAGIVAGTVAALRGKSALEREGLEISEGGA